MVPVCDRVRFLRKVLPTIGARGVFFDAMLNLFAGELQEMCRAQPTYHIEDHRQAFFGDRLEELWECDSNILLVIEKGSVDNALDDAVLEYKVLLSRILQK